MELGGENSGRPKILESGETVYYGDELTGETLLTNVPSVPPLSQPIREAGGAEQKGRW